jgi:hypothetical protein
MQKQVGRQFPDRKMVDHQPGDQGERAEDVPEAGLMRQITQHEDRGIANEQPFYALREIGGRKESV